MRLSCWEAAWIRQVVARLLMDLGDAAGVLVDQMLGGGLEELLGAADGFEASVDIADGLLLAQRAQRTAHADAVEQVGQRGAGEEFGQRRLPAE